QLGNCIGGGRFKSVFRAFNLNTGQMVAVKRVDLRGWRKGEVEQLMREIDLVKQLSHPSIIKYEGMTRDKDMLNIVLEYAENGTLEQTLKAFGKLNEKLVASYVTKLLDGLNYIHCSGVVHGDLRAANILTTKDGSVKLSNFGRSEIEIVMGSPNWVAPEVLELKGMSTKSDIWSLGCAVMELLTGQPPYADMADDVQVLRIVEGTPPLIPESFCDPLVVFLKECFHKEPAERPKAKELLIHAWLKNHCGVKKVGQNEVI
ncbi:kinase-like domain-containing protein, partial [Russula compacta]